MTSENNPVLKEKRKTRYYGKLEVRHVPWVFAIPGIVLVLALRHVPSLAGAGYSFTNWNGLSFSADFTGLTNYTNIFAEQATRDSLWHTILIAVLMVLFANVIGLLLAMVLRIKLKLRNLYRALFFLPFALTRLATGYIWQYILTYDGPFNQFLRFLGLDEMQRAWLADPKYAIYMVVLVLVWQYIGLALVIYLAGLEGIPEELDDAVAVDGAKALMKFKRVTFPLLAPAVTVSMTLTMIWGLATFDQIFALTMGGPVNATETLATMTWKTTFQFGLFGKGSAFAVLLTIIIAIFAVLQNGLLRKREESL